VPSSRRSNSLAAFAVTAPGLEALCAAELASLGIAGKAEQGGVAWSGSLESVARANLWLRTASRVIVRVAEFRATAFFELEQHARQIPWPSFVSPGSAVGFRVTCRKSKLYHSDAVGERFADAVTRRVVGAQVGTTTSVADADEATATTDHQQFVVRFLHDVCTVSADSSGALLHLRGYRQQLAKAPLRETLAAAVLLASGWNGDVPFIDPMCGAGTLPIEAALIARRMAPGRDRTFAFLRWPSAEAARWPVLLSEARAGERPFGGVTIAGSDRDEGAIAAARANAVRAGVGGDVEFVVQPISALPSAEPPGLIGVNPPYGIRIGETAALRNLYAQLGNIARRRRPGWDLALLSAERPLERQVGLPFVERLRSRNGGIPVRLLLARVPKSP
jgi:putative N6-adenine-specific DNA methylase